MEFVEVRNATNNNLKNITISIPLGKYVVFVGKSGSGKSTLAVNTIVGGYINNKDNVIVPVKPALFAQRTEIPSTKKTLASFFNDKEDKFEKDINSYVSNLNTKINKDMLRDIIELLGIGKIKMSLYINTLSMTLYNKCRFLKLIISTDARLLVIDELSATMTYHDVECIAKIYSILVKNGYSIFAIDHSLSIINNSEYVIEMGPEAGKDGGQVVFAGSINDYKKTVQWKNILLSYNTYVEKKQPSNKRLRINEIEYHNIHNMDLVFPLNRIVCICGGMCSGKSSLLDIIYKACDKSPTAWKNREGLMGDIDGKVHLRRPYMIDQSPIGKNSMSTPATYTSIMDGLRNIYFNISKDNGYTLSDFSYNADGKCNGCNGKGYNEIDLDENIIFERCSKCGGKRYNEHTLIVKDEKRDIGDVLNLTCKELFDIYKDDKTKRIISEKIKFLNDVGLPYLTLGQPSGTLSGGESQRIKISKELSKKLGDRCIFILDSPAKGLHVLDLPKIMTILRRLVGKNNSVVICENSPYFLRNSDWLIYLDKGKAVYQGIPDDLPKKLKNVLGVEENYE